MNIFDSIICQSFTEQLKIQNFDNDYIEKFNDNIINNKIVMALDMLATSAKISKTCYDIGKNILDLSLMEQEDNGLDESLFKPKPLHDFDKITISKTKIRQTITILQNLLNEPAKPSKSESKQTRVSKGESSKQPPKPKTSNSRSKKTTVLIKKGSNVDNNLPIISNEDDNNNLPVFEKSLLQKINKQKEESDEEPANKFSNTSSDEEDRKYYKKQDEESEDDNSFNPINMNISTKMKIDSTPITSSSLEVAQVSGINNRMGFNTVARMAHLNNDTLQEQINNLVEFKNPFSPNI
jgi:hypothetical protein